MSKEDPSKPQNKGKLDETVALLAAEQVRSRHLTSNWFHQTWKLHCYLVFCLSGSKKFCQSVLLHL